MDYKELIKNLWEEAAFQRCRFSRFELADELEEAVTAIETLLAERDAAVAELDRIAEFTESEFLGYLNNEIHQNCGYEYYTALFDLLCEVTNWKYEDKWRGPTPPDKKPKGDTP